MSIFPKIEKITRDAAICHFLLMFGYKVFALYFPLFLVTKGMSLPEVGYTYLLIYLPIALSAPFVGFLNHKINPAILASLGVLGYAIYASGMILIINPVLFYFWQVLLGISAALFFVSARAILISTSLENYNRAFGWFYSAPFYADAIAPAVGAAFIWQFDFLGVFIFSLVLQFLTAIFCFTQLRKREVKPLDKYFNFEKFQENYQRVFQTIKTKTVLPFLLASLSILFLAGFYRAFFVLFLKDELLWSENLILIFISIFSFLFLPISLFLIRHLGKIPSEKNIFQGSIISGLFSILFGTAMPFLNFLNILLINLGRLSGALICNAGRSGLVSQRLKDQPEEAGAVDTIFAPLGVALGALISGVVVGFLGYQFLFILGGIFVIIIGISMKKVAKFGKLR